MSTETRRKFLIDVAFFAVVGAIIYFAFKFLSLYMLPFVIGIAASFLVQRPAKALNQKTKLPKNILTVILVILIYFAILALVVLIGYLLYIWISKIIGLLPGVLPTVTKALNDISVSALSKMKDLPPSTAEYLNALPEKIIGALTTLLTSLLPSTAKGIAATVPGFLISVIVTVVASCYISKDYDSIIEFSSNVLPKKVWGIICDIKEMFVKTIFKILRGYLLLMMITFAELCLGLLIIGQKNFVMLAAIISIVDILPVLGTGTVVLPWALFSLITGNVLKSVELLLLYIVITVVRNFLEPKIIGEQVGLHPLITLLSIFCGYKLIGFFGIFLFPITLIVIHELMKAGKIKIFGYPYSKE